MLLLIDGYNLIAPVAPPGRRPRSERAQAPGRRWRRSGHLAGPPPKDDWLRQERQRLLERLARNLDAELAAQTVVVFDAARPLPEHAARQRVAGLDVRFAVDHAEADDLIEELIAAHHSPKRLSVVSSDHRLQAAAARAGAVAFDAQPWLDALLEGRLLLAIPWPPAGGGPREPPRGKGDAVAEHDVAQWLRLFGLAPEPDAPPRSVAPLEPAAPPRSVAPPEPVAPPESDAPPRPDAGDAQGRGRARRAAPPPPSPSPSPPPVSPPANSLPFPAAPPAPPAPPQPPPAAPQQRQPHRGQPRRQLPEDPESPFPEGYGEDLL